MRPRFTIVALGLAALLTCEEATAASGFRRTGNATQPVSESPALSAERRGIAVLPNASKRCPDPCEPLRSLIVTDVEILSHFRFHDVMERLACPPEYGCDPREARSRARAMFTQWWSTQTEAGPGPGPYCSKTMFGFAFECGRAEGDLAVSGDPFADGVSGFVAIGLFNRIDLADAKGRDCGEYRIVFARRSGIADENQRLLINFEAVLPNPEGGRSLAGCKAIARFWHKLSRPELDVSTRAGMLKDFYFFGRDDLPGVAPVVRVDHYGARRCKSENEYCPTGQVRTNQRMQLPWSLREFRLTRDTSTGLVGVRLTTVKDTPYGELFSKSGTSSDFQRAFLDLTPHLARRTKDDLCYGTEQDCGHSPDRFNPGESQIRENGTNDYIRQFRDADTWFSKAVSKKLRGTSVSPTQLINRAQVLSCAGCHELSNSEVRAELGGGQKWPLKTKPFKFVHVTEQHVVGTGAARRFATSEALKEFAEHRLHKLGYVLQFPEEPARHGAGTRP